MNLLDTRRPRLLLVALCLVVWLPGFFTLPPTDRDESRFAQASKQMIESGDYIRIMNGDEARNRKPIGIYWMQVPFVALARTLHIATDNPIWPYRVPSLLGGLLAVLATYEVGRVLGDPRAALLAAAMLATSMVLVAETHLAKTDAALLGFTTLAMAVLVKAYLRNALPLWQAALFWLAIGVGILLKGPITPMIAGLCAATLVIIDRRARWLLTLRPGAGIWLMLLVVMPWFVAIGYATHGAFFDDAVGGDLGRKLTSGDNAHGAPPGLHVLLLPLLAFPATLPVLLALPHGWRQRRDPVMVVLLAWIIPAWIVFEAVPTKLPHYTLPLYPAIFLMAARALSQPPTRRWSQAAIVLTTVAAASILIFAAVLPVVVHANPMLGGPVALAVVLIGWLAVQRERPMLTLAAMPLLTAALLGWELPQMTPLWIAPQITRAMQQAGIANRPLVSVGFREPSLMFLAGTDTDLAINGPNGARALATGEVDAALVTEQEEPAFRAEAARLSVQLRPITTINGFNYSRGRAVRLTLYRLASAEG